MRDLQFCADLKGTLTLPARNGDLIMPVQGPGLQGHLLDGELARLGGVALGEVQQRHAVVPRVARGLRLAVVACHLQVCPVSFVAWSKATNGSFKSRRLIPTPVPSHRNATHSNDFEGKAFKRNHAHYPASPSSSVASLPATCALG